MPKYVNDSGEKVTADDPNRLVFYSAAGTCGFWTDDWDQMKTHGKHGIPCCPTCGCVGMQSTAKEWFEGAAEFEKKNARYVEFLNFSKSSCGRPSNAPSYLKRYHEWLATEHRIEMKKDAKEAHNG